MKTVKNAHEVIAVAEVVKTKKARAQKVAEVSEIGRAHV